MNRLYSSANLGEISVGCLVGKHVKVWALADSRMQVTHLNDGGNHSSVAQYLQDGIAIFFCISDRTLPILQASKKKREKGKVHIKYTACERRISSRRDRCRTEGLIEPCTRWGWPLSLDRYWMRSYCGRKCGLFGSSPFPSAQTGGLLRSADESSLIVSPRTSRRTYRTDTQKTCT